MSMAGVTGHTSSLSCDVPMYWNNCVLGTFFTCLNNYFRPWLIMKVQKPSVLWNLTLLLSPEACSFQVWEGKAEHTVLTGQSHEHCYIGLKGILHEKKKGFKTRKKICMWKSITCHQPQINQQPKNYHQRGNTRWDILPLFIHTKPWSSFIFGLFFLLKSKK